ncbi:hypothetical protein G9A89_008193 [Geosiphon pyriformis]|nr:hypothetical protein G9A89_008193 [Geosiphon pyriformis]
MATLPIEIDIETILFEEITIGNYKDILQRSLGTILDSLKLKKKKPYKTLSLSVDDLVLKYHSDRDNVYVLNNGSYILQDQYETIFNNRPIKTFYTFHEYWIKNYPNATLTIEKQTTITDNSGTHTVIRPKKTTTKRERIGSKMDKYLLESITAAILTPSMTIGKTIMEILPIDKNLLYGRQQELYGRFGEIIE